MLLRPAEPDDAIHVARVHIRSWQVAYRTLLPEDFLNQLRPEDRAQRYDFASHDPQKPWTIVAVEDGLIRGFATTSPSRDPDPEPRRVVWLLCRSGTVGPGYWPR